MLSALLTRPVRAAETSTQPPDYLIRNYTSDDGMRSDVVYSIAQDREGYLWCATHAGLARFDGVRFTIFDRDNTPALGTRAIYWVEADLDGRLWIADEHYSLSIRESGAFRAVVLPPGPDGQPEWVRFRRQDSQRRTWITTRSGRTIQWSEDTARPGPSVPQSSAIQLEPWPGNGPDWHRIEDPAGSAARFGHLRDGRFVEVADPEGHGRFRSATCFPRLAGGLWMLEGSTGDRRLRALLPDGSMSSARAIPRWPEDSPAAYLEDRQGNIWIGLLGAGIVRIAPDGSARRFSRRDGLGTERIRGLLLDREGNIWAATDGGGLSRFTPRRFRMFGRAEGLPSEIIYSVTPAPVNDGGGLWVATHGGGVQRMRDGAFNKLDSFDPFPWTVHVPADGSLWVGDLMDGLGTSQGGKPKKLVQGRQIDALCDDPAGGGWAGGFGLLRWQDGSATVVTNFPGRGIISSLACARDGTLWIGTLGDGLWRRRDGAYTRFGRAEGLGHDEVNALYLDPQNVLWIGTTGAGLVQMKEGRITAIRETDGLADRCVCGIAEDGRGHLWFTSLGGIFRVARRELEDFCEGRGPRISSQRFDRDDGVSTIQCTGSSQPKIARTDDGRMWFATLRGLASADPATLGMNTNPPPVVIEHLRVDGVDSVPGPVHPVLAAGTRRIEVHYTALSLTAPDKVRFRHRLEGRGDAWSEAEGRRFAAFDGLGPGEHRFRVIAANNDGVWNETGASLAFTVLPFFWQTFWFQAAAGGLALGTVGWSVRFVSLRKVRRQLAAIERQQAIDRERARIARDMHDDVGAALTQLTLLSSQADEEGPGTGPGAAPLRQVTALSREIVGKLDELVWTVNPRHDTTIGLVDYLCHHAEESLRGTGLRLRYDIAAGLASLPVSADARHQLFLAFKEALNNVLKHAAATEVRLRVQSGDGVLRVAVEDDGRGFDPAKTDPTSEGLGNLRQRLAALGGRCEITARTDGGTVVEFHLPLSDASAPEPSGDR